MVGALCPSRGASLRRTPEVVVGSGGAGELGGQFDNGRGAFFLIPRHQVEGVVTSVTVRNDEVHVARG